MFQCAPHPLGYFSWFSLHDSSDSDPENWTFSHYISYPESRDDVSTKSLAEHVEHQKILAKKFCDPFKSAFAWTPTDLTTAWHGKLQRWDPQAPGHGWDNHAGRITLAGDAAHPMTFQRGQGLNHAITDALKLSEAIIAGWSSEGKFTTEQRMKSISQYEEEMISRGGEEVRVSEMTTVMMHDWEHVFDSPVMKKGVSPST